MASSSSSSYFTHASSSQLWNHDVFVSFKGGDTRKTFVDHLYSALDQRGILTYKGDETLHVDELGGPSLQKAIEESQIAIVIFSSNYAHSSWCLNELTYIMKCMYKRGQMVIPIFYGVHCWEVQKQKGRYGKVFVGHKRHYNSKVESWRKALVGAANLFGWVADGSESKCIKEVVDTISNRLFANKDLVGIGTPLQDLKHGGGDKTTLASSHEEVEHFKIPLQHILLATNTFAKENIIAGGGFGKVYKGQSEKHGIIAVKQLDRTYGQGDHEFMMEIALLSAYKHENIVSLVGFCDEGEEKILVYKYERNGSLNKVLHSKDLTWIQRLQICLDAARGLKYLHDDVGPQHRILHRDVKSANILLDENLKAKISDFGLSKIALANVPCTVLISNACGTIGYLDPQYLKHGILTQKSDVYSFGVVLFEVLCGKLASVAEFLDEHYFSVKLAKNHYERETLEDIIDSDLRNQMNSTSLSTFSTIAYQCLKKRGEERPTMSLVVKELEKALDYQQVVAPT